VSLVAASRLSAAIARWIQRITIALAWLLLASLLVVTTVHVLGRQFVDVESEALSELAGDLFFALAMVSFGFAYLEDGHVRVDVVRERFGARRLAWIELLGCLLIAVPLGCLLLDYGGRSAWASLVQRERSVAILDLPLQWVVKAAVPLGFLSFLLSAVSIAIQNCLFLLGDEPSPAPRGDHGGHVS
jgi:TRAP-type mannitol/chloroaromatic compound transport system permease small subunit